MRFFVIGSVLIPLLLSSAAWAARRSFVPTISDYSGYTQIDALYETTSQKAEGNSTRRSRNAFRELIDLGLTGYVYHPRFITFLAKAALGLKEEKYSYLEQQSDWYADSAESYELRAVVLPTHPYNLEVFTRLMEPLLTGSYFGGQPIRKRTSGAVLRYRKSPWAGTLSYTNDKTENQIDSTSDIYQAHLSYHTVWLSFNTDYSHDDFTSSDGVTSKLDHISLDNRIGYHHCSLLSGLRFQEESRNEPSFVSSEFSRMTWDENLDADLPWNFHSRLTYNKNNDETTITREDGGLTAPTRTTHSDRYALFLQHHLYNSLSSGFNAIYGENRSTGGMSTQSDYRLFFNYTKKLFLGRLLVAPWVGRDELKIEGAPEVMNEIRQVTPVTHQIELENLFIDAGTISIQVRDPANPGRTSLLSASDYVVEQLGNVMRITIISLPANFSLIDIDNYEFLVTYALLPSHATLTTDSYGYSLRLYLLDDSVIPYYEHEQNRQKISQEGSSSLLGEPDQQASDSAGLDFRHSPFEAGGRYQRIVSRRNPQRRWLIYSGLREPFADGLYLYTRLDHEEITYLPAIRQEFLEEEKAEKVTRLNASLHASLPEKRITASLGGTYGIREGTVRSNFYSARALLTWRLGLAEIDLTATYTGDDTSFADTESRTRSTSVLLRVRRRIF